MHPQQLVPISITSHGTIVNPSIGTLTPVPLDVSMSMSMSMSMSDDMQIDLQPQFECPCGHLHGPGQGSLHDVHAVGLSDHPLLRGPD